MLSSLPVRNRIMPSIGLGKTMNKVSIEPLKKMVSTSMGAPRIISALPVRAPKRK
jgi:hypothetical protein